MIMTVSATAVAKPVRHPVLLIGIAYAGFFVLGVLGGLLGVAWPSMRASFHVPLDALGLILGASTLGYTLSSLNVGRIISRVGLGPVLVASSAVSVTGILGYALSPSWWSLICAVVVAAAGGASIDVSLNTYVASRSDPRLMTWLHASAGLGITLGPALMTTALTVGRSWRYGYGVGSLLPLLLALTFLLTVARWHSARSEASTTRSVPVAPEDSCYSLDRYAPWLAIALAFFYAGVEKTTGQWSYSFLTEARSVPGEVAGIWMSIFWGTFTLGRVLTGFAIGRLPAYRLLRWSMIGMCVGSTFIWFKVSISLSLVGLAILGLSLAPVYPLLMSSTSRRVGPTRAAKAISFQVSAASLGSSTLPALVGLIAQAHGLEIVGPFLLGLCLVVAGLCERAVCRAL
jgi:fucose permease